MHTNLLIFTSRFLKIFHNEFKIHKISKNKVSSIIKNKIQKNKFELIEFDNVSFSYGNKAILKNVKFTIEKKSVCRNHRPIRDLVSRLY